MENCIHFINKLNAADLQAIQSGFSSQIKDRHYDLSLNCSQFCELLSLVLSKGKEQDYEELFRRVDISGNGVIDWDKLCSFLLLEYYEREDRVKAAHVPQWKALKDVPCAHKDNICRILKMSHPPRYCTVSKDGLVCFTDMNLEVVRKEQVQPDADEMRNRDLWVTSAVIMSNVSKIAISTTGKVILIYDISGKSLFSCDYKIYGLPHLPLCLHYWNSEYNGNHAVLTYGDTEGNIHVFSFSSALTALFDKPLKSDASQDSCYSVDRKSIMKGLYPSVQYMFYHAHSAWTRQVQYIPLLDCYLSCSTTSSDSMVLGWPEKNGSKFRLTIFKVMLGLNSFDYDQRMNIIATAGVNTHVCLWNPYVVSKPIGVLRGHMQIVVTVSFIESKSQLISLSKDNVLRIWDVNLQICLQRLTGVFPKKIDACITMLFDSEQLSLLTSFNSQLVVLSMKPDVKHRITSHELPITGMVYNDTFQQLISVCEGSCIAIWFVDTGQRVKQFKNAHGNAEISCIALDESKSRFLTGSVDGSIKVWDLNGHCHQILLPEQGNPCDISEVLSLKRNVIAVGWTRQVCCFDTSTAKDYYVDPSDWRGRQSHIDDISTSAFVPPRTLATGSYQGEVVLWNMASQNSFSKLMFPESASKNVLPPLVSSPSRNQSSRRRHRSSSVRSSISANVPGKRSGKVSSSGRLTDLKSFQGSPDEATDDFAVSSILFLYTRSNKNPSTGDLVSCYSCGTVCFWNTLTGTLLAQFKAHDSAESLVASSDEHNQYLVTGCHTGMCRVWSISSYCIQQSVSLYEPFSTDLNTQTSAPVMLSEMNYHADMISALVVLKRNDVTLIASSSYDASIALHTVSGHLVGVFGQELHWQLPTSLSLSEVKAEQVHESDVRVSSNYEVNRHDLNNNTNATEDSLIFNADSLHEENTSDTITADVTCDLDEMVIKQIPGQSSDARTNKRNVLHGNMKPHSDKVYSNLCTKDMADVPELKKPSILNQVPVHAAKKNVHALLPQASDPIPDSDLKLRHDEKSIFPKSVLDMELKMKTAHKLALLAAEQSKPPSVSKNTSRSYRGKISGLTHESHSSGSFPLWHQRIGGKLSPRTSNLSGDPVV